MRKVKTLREILPAIETAGYLTSEAKRILIKSTDSIVRSFHVLKLTNINKIIFLKYFSKIIESVKLRLKAKNVPKESDNITSDIKQSTETDKVNDYIKEKLQRALTVKSGSVIVFQYTDEQGTTTNRTAMVVGGNEGPERTWFTSKDGEVFLRAIDLSKLSDLNEIFKVLQRQQSIQDDNKGKSPDISYGNMFGVAEFRTLSPYNNFRSFNVNRISYMSTIKLGSTKD